MRRITILLSAVVLSAFAFSLSAQNDEFSSSNLSKGKKNWFISLGGAASILQGEQDRDFPFADRLRYSGEISVGKWFNPFVGTRVQLMGGTLRGMNYMNVRGGSYTNSDRSRTPFPTGYIGTNEFLPGMSSIDPSLNWMDASHWTNFKLTEVNGQPAFWQEFNYGAVAIDVMGNLSNLFRGYWGQEHAFDFIPYIGGGIIHARPSATNPASIGFLGRVGFRTNFNLNSKWAVFLEPQVNWASTELDGYEGNRVCDMVGNLFLGVQFNINRDFSNPATLLSAEEISYINDRINENRGLIETQQSILERQQNLIERLDGRVTNIEKSSHANAGGNSTIVRDRGFIPDYIRFSLNSSRIQASELSKLDEVAAYLKANPDSKLLLVGYADKKTGSKSYNMSLSHARAQSVASALTDLGINPKRLIQEWKGDNEQPFAQNDWNRVVILVERK